MGLLDDVVVRDEQPADWDAVRCVNEAAFGQADEADLVDALRAAGAATISLVAERRGQVIGHILFSPVTVEHAPSGMPALGLAPMAVVPEHQSQGVGTSLVRSGVERCRVLGVPVVVVLGHPLYYPRFGFRRASRFGLRCGFDAPDEAFMVLETRPGALTVTSGLVAYHRVFGSP